MLDIETPDLNGIDFIKYGKNIPPVIFISGNKTYKESAEKLGAVAFIDKPVRVNKLYQAIEKLTDLNYNSVAECSRSLLKEKPKSKKLTIKLEEATSLNLKLDTIEKKEATKNALLLWKPIWSKW